MFDTKRFFQWLSVRPSWKEFGGLVLNFYFYNIIWVVGVLIVGALVFWLSGNAMPEPNMEELRQSLSSRSRLAAFLIVVLVVLFEEICFRFVPFTAGLLLVKSGLDEEKTILATIVAASLAFGAAHATNHDSLSIGAIAQSILIQGFGGILMSVLFLKYCGLRLKYVLTALVATTLYHLGWNTVLMSSILFVR